MQYKCRSLIYIFLAIYLKLQYGDFLLIAIVYENGPIKCFCLRAVFIVELGWNSPCSNFSLILRILV